MTLNCEAYDIISGKSAGPLAQWTVTVDYAKKYAYVRGPSIYGAPVGVGDVKITPGQITLPPHNATSTATVETALISRTSGAVVVEVHDLRKEMNDIFAKNDEEGRSRFVGTCEPGTLLPIPLSKF